MSPGVVTTIKWVFHVGQYAWAIPALCGLIKWNKSAVGAKLLTILVIVGFLVEEFMSIYEDTLLLSQLMFRIYTIIEFGMITAYFITITKLPRIRRVMYYLSILILPIAIFDYLMGGPTERDDLTIGVESLIFVGYCIVVLYNTLKEGEHERITSTSSFWAISAILIYFGANIFVFISSNYVRSISLESSQILWTVHEVFNIIFYFILAVALWKAKDSH